MTKGKDSEKARISRSVRKIDQGESVGTDGLFRP